MIRHDNGNTNKQETVTSRQSIRDLFELARVAAMRGDYADKVSLYNIILGTPEAQPEDKNRVQTYFADLLRRGGDPNRAQLCLEALHKPNETSSIEYAAEYWQALGQCFFHRGEFQNALDTEINIVNHPYFNTLPIDKQLYYYETAIAMKVALSSFDEQLSGFLKSYETILDVAEESLDPATLKRAKGKLADLKGDFLRFSDARDLKDSFLLYVEAFDTHILERNKAVSGAKAVIVAEELNIQSSKINEILVFVISAIVNDKLQPTDLVQCADLRAIKERGNITIAHKAPTMPLPQHV